jgi:hypothetical protein
VRVPRIRVRLRLHPSFLLFFSPSILLVLLLYYIYMHGIARESCVDQLSRRSRFFTISSRFRVQDRITTRPASELANSKTIETFSFNCPTAQPCVEPDPASGY